MLRRQLALRVFWSLKFKTEGPYPTVTAGHLCELSRCMLAAMRDDRQGLGSRFMSTDVAEQTIVDGESA